MLLNVIKKRCILVELVNEMKFGSIAWILDKQDIKKDYYKREHHDAKGKLKYCEECECTWEISTTGSQHSYTHLPTYKLPRIKCRLCQKKQ